MMDVNIKIKKTADNAIIPSYATAQSAGADLYSCNECPIEIPPGEARMISTGISVELSVGTVGLIFARSGMAVKRCLAPSNKVGVIDSDYRGEIKVSLYNHGKEPQVIEYGERVAQLVIMPYYRASFTETDELSNTERGAGGFGSTGNK